MHTMERYLNHGENMEMTDGISEALIATVMKSAKILKNDHAVQAREKSCGREVYPTTDLLDAVQMEETGHPIRLNMNWEVCSM